MAHGDRDIFKREAAEIAAETGKRCMRRASVSARRQARSGARYQAWIATIEALYSDPTARANRNLANPASSVALSRFVSARTRSVSASSSCVCVPSPAP